MSEDKVRNALAENRSAPVSFKLRNYNGPDTPAVTVEGDRIVAWLHCDIPSLFPELTNWMKEHTPENGYIHVSEFVENGPELARLIGRELTIWHQYGSGKPEAASYEKYGPFQPS